MRMIYWEQPKDQEACGLECLQTPPVLEVNKMFSFKDCIDMIKPCLVREEMTISCRAELMKWNPTHWGQNHMSRSAEPGAEWGEGKWGHGVGAE